MAVTRLASQCPAPMVSTGLIKRSDARVSASGNAPAAPSFYTGLSPIGAFNDLALLADLALRYSGGPLHCICTGLVVSAASGGAISVGAGHANISGVIELSADATGIGVVSGWNYIYLLAAASGGTGTVQVVSGSTTPPTGQSVFLGAINVSSGAGALDTSGVIYDRGAIAYRETADTGVPSDTPSASVMLLTKTLVGLWLWTGTAHIRLDRSNVTGETPTGTVNGTNAAFALANTPLTGSVAVYVGASATTLQRFAPSAYSVAGSTITFGTAPATGSVILVDYRH